MAKKFDFDSLVDNIKSVINPAGGTPEVDPNDALGVKIASLSVKVQELMQSQQEQIQELAEVNKLLNGLFQDLEAIRNPTPTEKEGGAAASAKPEASAKSEATTKQSEPETSDEPAESQTDKSKDSDDKFE